jgi:hypothetical protein
MMDTMVGLARFFHVAQGRQHGKDLLFPETRTLHKQPDRYNLSANSGGWGGVFLQDSESGVVRFFTVEGRQVGPDYK